MKKTGLTIAGKIGVMNAVLLLLLVGSLFYVRFETNRATTAIKAQGATFSRWETANAVSSGFSQVKYWWTEYTVSGQMASEKNAKAAQEELTSLLANLQGAEQDDSLGSKIDEYVKSMDGAVVVYLGEDNRVRGNVLARQARQIADEIEGELSALVAEAQTNAKAAGQMVIGANARMDNISLFLLVGLPALGLFLGWFFSRTITRPIKTIGEVMSDIAEGEENLTQRIEVGTRDEITALAEGFNTVVDKLHGIISQTAQAAEQVADVTQQSAEGAQQSVQAAIELAELSNQLQGLVGQFQLHENGRADAAAFIQPQNALAAVAGAHFGNETR